MVERCLDAAHDAVGGIQPSRTAVAALDRRGEGVGVLDRREHATVEQVGRHDREPVAGQSVGEVAHRLIQTPPGVQEQDGWSRRWLGRRDVGIGIASGRLQACHLSHA
jgi:hypothetical protein